MCLHVLCLTLKGPPLLSFRHIYGVSPHSSPSHSLSVPLSLSIRLGSVKPLQPFVPLVSYDFLLSFSTLEHCSQGKSFCFWKDEKLELTKTKVFRELDDGSSSMFFTGQNMSFFERKKVIKLSANLAMASANEGRTRWSRATIAKGLRDEDSRTMAKKILGHQYSLRIQSKKILKRSKFVSIKRRSSISASRQLPSKWMARNLSKNRTKILKNLLPGGELMDDVSLIEETLDYISSLRAQVDVMRCLVKASECLNGK